MRIPRFLLEDSDIITLEKRVGAVKKEKGWIVLTKSDFEILSQLMRVNPTLSENYEDSVFMLELASEISELYRSVETVADKSGVLALVMSVHSFSPAFPRQMVRLLENWR